MFFDARRLDSNVVDADVCIVGAGAAGITMACRFAGTSLSVLLLKSGGFELDQETQSLYDGDNVSFDKFPLQATRLRYFGGTTNHWGGMTPRLSSSVMAPRPDMPLSGWPIAHDELIKYYPAAEKICQLGGAEWDKTDHWQRITGHKPLHLARGAIVPKIVFCSPPTRFGIAYRSTLKAAKNVKVFLYGNAREVVVNDSTSHAERIEVQCIGGNRFSVKAKVFVLALGGLETPRLLLLSRAQAPAGLGNIYGNVGRHYMDHPNVSGGLLQLSANAPDYGFFEQRVTKDGRRVTGLFVPKPGVVEDEGIGDFRVGLSPAPSPPAGLRSLRELSHFYSNPEVGVDLGRHLANILLDIDQVGNVVAKNVFGRNGGYLTSQANGNLDGRTAWCEVCAEQFPNPDSRVSLAHDTDIFGQQRIRLDWRLKPTDLRTMRRAMQLFAAAVAACGHGRVRLTRELLTSNFLDLVEIASHPMGTTRMSSDPRKGVVDANLLVHGMDNLYVCSSSTWPTSGGWMNPTLTIVALAVRMAERIRQQFEGRNVK